MGKTLAEKILGEHADRDLTSGDIVVADVDLCLLNDGTGLEVARQLEEQGIEKLVNPRRSVLCFDRTAPASTAEIANNHVYLRDFAMKTSVTISDVGQGICHNVIIEQYVSPGDILVGADDHTCATGALGAFATGLDSSDIADVLAKGNVSIQVPETIKIFLTGEFPVGVFAKDVILHLIGLLGVDGASGKALEFCGPAIESINIESRCTLTSMAAETGAITGLIASDEMTKKYLAKMGREKKWRPIDADPDAVYSRVLEINIADLEPIVSFPHNADNTRSITEAVGVTINQVVLGGCSNSRLEDWEVVARIVRGKKKAPGIRIISVPGSKMVEKQVLDAGYYQVLSEFGAMFLPPGCGPCAGVMGGIPADGDKVLTTSNSNAIGQMGNLEAEIYLASPATIAASSIEGVIADPRKYADELISKTFSTVVRTEAIKKVALTTMDSIEKVAADTAKKWGPRIKETSGVIEEKTKKAAADTAKKLGPKLKETSETIEAKTKKIIEKYEPQAKKAAVDLEKTIKTLARDATKAIKDILAARKEEKETKTDKPAESRPTKKTAAPTKTVKKAVKKKATGRTTKKTAKTVAKKTTRKTTVKKAAKKKASPGSSSKKGSK